MRRKFRIGLASIALWLLGFGVFLLWHSGVGKSFPEAWQSSRPEPFTAAEREWILKAMQRLQSYRLPNTPKFVPFKDGVYEVEDGDLVRIGYGGWLYFASHSIHDSVRDLDLSEAPTNCPSPDPEAWIGDINLTVDNRGKMHLNTAHPCSSITLRPRAGRPFLSVREFRSSSIEGEDHLGPWRRITPDDPALQKTPVPKKRVSHGIHVQ